MLSAVRQALPRLIPTHKQFLISTSFLATMSEAKKQKLDNSKFTIACIQLLVGEDKEKNLKHALSKIQEAKNKGASMVVLPECFNSPYSTAAFPKYAEPVPECTDFDISKINPIDSPSIAMLSKAAADCGVTLVAGSIPEVAEVSEKGMVVKKYYNTCTVYDKVGQLVAKHRKMHLFDINVPGGVRFMESDILSPGNKFTTFQTEHCKVGVSICYDIRFPEMAQLTAADDEVKMLVYPAAFNTTTGPLHWELLQRARAVDNQLYVVTASPARCPGAAYQAWGHSSITNPWGKVLATTEHDEDIVVAEVDLAEVEKIRTAIPVRMQRRSDLYLTQKL